MDTRKFAVQQAVKLVSTMSIENKTKAVFDLADEIGKWISEQPIDSEAWWKKHTITLPKTHIPVITTSGAYADSNDATVTTSGYSDTTIKTK